MKTTYRYLVVLLFLTFLASCSSGIKIDYSKELNTSFKIAKETLLKEKFIEQPNQLVNKEKGIYRYSFTNYDSGEYPLNINLYAENENSNIKYMELQTNTTNIDVLLYFQFPYALITGKHTPGAIYGASHEHFEYIQDRAKFLNCSSEYKFLTSGFKCASDYKVNGYTQDNVAVLNGLAKSRLVTITVQPQ